MCKCKSTTARLNGTVQLTFFLVMRLNISIAATCDSLIVILIIKAWKWTEETRPKRDGSKTHNYDP